MLELTCDCGSDCCDETWDCGADSLRTAAIVRSAVGREPMTLPQVSGARQPPEQRRCAARNGRGMAPNSGS
jgi:hypothetical protein